MKEYIPDFKIVSRVLIFFMIIFSGVTSIHAQWELVDSIEYNQFITSPGFQNSINGAPVDCHLDVLQRSASIQKVVSPGDFAAVSYKLEAGFIYRYSFFVKPRDSEVYYHMKISKASGDSILDYAKGQTGDQNFTYTSGEFLGVDGAAASCGVIHKITSGPVVGDDSTRLLKVECSRVNKTGTSMRATRFARCYIERKFDDSNPIPTAPDSFMVKTFTDSASFTWVDRAFNEKGFKLERKEAGGEFQEIAAIDSNKTSFTDKTLLKNIAYHYRIYAWNDSGVSAFSDTIGVILYDAPPDKPTAFTLLVKDSRRIDLSWNDESNDEYGFVLQYSTTGTWDDFTEISFDPGTTTFNHYRLDQNALYDYRLFAQNNMGSSDTVYASAATPQPGPEDGYLLPDDDFIINVIDFGATGDGQTDDTEALQEAMNYGVGKFVYFPDGTYLISDRLEWPDDARFAPLIIFGQSRENTIIQLTDDNPLFQSDTRAVVWTNKMGSADNFRNYIKHITVNTGSGNPGAVGVQFMSNNMGAIEDISIISGDGTGKIGLDLAYNGLNGPLLVKNVSISGFDIGIKSSGEVNSQTMEHVNLEGQNQYGIMNSGQVLSVRGVISNNNIPAIYNSGNSSVLTLLDSDLKGGNGSDYAILNSGMMFARSIVTDGYSKAIENVYGTGIDFENDTVTEFISHKGFTLFDWVDTVSLNLEIKETPQLPWENDLSQWANVKDYGALGDGSGDDSQAIRDAIASGKKVLYFPKGSYPVSGTIDITGNIERVIGFESDIAVGTQDNAVFRLPDSGSSPDTVEFSHISVTPTVTTPAFNNTSADRVMVVKNAKGAGGTHTGKGSIFLEDIGTGVKKPLLFLGGEGQHAWIRQISNEPRDGVTHLENDGATVWILGHKTEQSGTLIETRNSGKTEVSGGFAYSVGGDNSLYPMYRVIDSYMSSTMGGSHYGSPPDHVPYDILVLETQGELTDTLFTGEAYARAGLTMFPLYVGYPAPEGTVPDDPGELTASLIVPDTSVLLSWRDNAWNEDGYVIERKTEDGNFVQVDTVEADKILFTDTEVQEGNTYHYRVYGFNVNGFSGYSNEASVTVNITSVHVSKSIRYSVFPNPASEILHIIVNGSDSKSHGRMMLTDISGKIIKSERMDDVNNSMNLTEFDPGIYFLRLEIDKRIYKEKIIIK